MQSPSPSLGLVHSDVTDQFPLLIGRRTPCPVYISSCPSHTPQSSFHSLPSHTRWLETAVYPRPTNGLRNAPYRPGQRTPLSPAASCLFTLHRPDQTQHRRRLPAPSSRCTGPTSDASPTRAELTPYCPASFCPSMPTHRASTPGQLSTPQI